ncbi:MAG: FecR domain-containing protein [Chitinivibrionales bacterium]|nr:FecR domain-containing protein [Chitinivibrionales bacterium]
MECRIFRDYLEERGCHDAVIPQDIVNHVNECTSCRTQFRLARALVSLKGRLEEAPKEILPNVETRIAAHCQRRNHHRSRLRFKWMLKPSFAVAALLLVLVTLYAYRARTSIGQVENLSQRFNIAQFHDIKPGDVLYASDNTTVTIRLKAQCTVRIHRKSLIKVNNSRQITLLAGELSLVSGDEELRIETPDGMVRARNTTARIRTTTAQEQGASPTETVCVVFDGTTTIACRSGQIRLDKGQKAAFTEKNGIHYRKPLTADESGSEMNNIVEHTIVAAIGSLCDCVFGMQRSPDAVDGHRQMSGSKANENRFKVRVFWQEKRLKGLVFRKLNDIYAI